MGREHPRPVISGMDTFKRRKVRHMRDSALIPALCALGAALFVSSCAADTTPPEEDIAAVESESASSADEPVDEVSSAGGQLDLADREPTENVPAELLGDGNFYITDPEQVSIPLSGETVDDPMYFDVPIEVFPQCSDEEALIANEGHAPAGWPQDWDGHGEMPAPECHPDFIETLSWEHFDAFSACWEGPETSTPSVEGIRDEADRRAQLWSMSRARADWEPSDGSCTEQWPEGDGAGSGGS